MTATVGAPPDRQEDISYTDLRIIGSGSFGVVYQARLLETNDSVAIKKVLQDKRFKVRERERGERERCGKDEMGGVGEKRRERKVKRQGVCV